MAKNGTHRGRRSDLTEARSKASLIALPAEERIRRRAYELYEQRGHADGFANQDWCKAEQEVLNGKDHLSPQS
jgi:hypothetical protein